MRALNVILLCFLALLSVAFATTGFGWTGILWFVGEDEKNAVLGFIGVAMGGTLLALNAVASHRRARAMEAAAEAQAKSMREQAGVNRLVEQGRRQDRLKNAVEHLARISQTHRKAPASGSC